LQAEDGVISHITLLCQNEQGYLNLSKLISKSFLENQQVVSGSEIALVKQSWLQEYNQGLIVLSGGLESSFGQAILNKNQTQIKAQAAWWQSHFPERFYIELIRNGKDNEEVYIQQALSVANHFDLPVVATNNVRFASDQDFEAHEVRTCINSGHVLIDQNRPKLYTDQQYFKSSQQMIELFKDIPSAIENTVEIAKRCSVDLTLGTYFLPDFPIPEGMTMDEYFIKVSHEGLEERLAFLFGQASAEIQAAKRKEYFDRIEFELNIILQMGFPGYFLIVADFIQWGKNHQIPVGPGRGSGAGSIVAYALKITDLDPIEYDLLFERFLNPERVSMPDFDVDFCMDRRDEVIDYVAQNYGRDHVSQIVTFGTMAAKAVVRDVGRVMGMSYGHVDSIAKLIPNELGIKLKDAVEEEEMKEKRKSDEDADQLLALALKLEGTVRNTGKHAGGVVIGPKPLDHFCPVQSEADATGVVTQLDKNDVEAAGLVKFDFLGLRTLTIIDWALNSINEGVSVDDENFLDIARIPIDDPKTFELIKTGKTTGIFQLESSGMQNLIVKLKPDCFEDIIALVALFRPGPLDSGMVDNFIKRKHGQEEVSYPDKNYQHEWLKPVLEPTYGVILYQEQVMQIAQVLAGYSLGGADLLRRAMGKKKPEEMAKQRSVFEAGAKEKGVDGDLAMKIFDLVEKFAGYGFNKSHSAAYALVSYQAAWLKTHYPSQFMAAQISSDMDSTEKVVHMVNECYAMGLEVLVPSVNESYIKFTPHDDRTVRYGLGAIKGAGEAALQGMIAEREASGPFKDLFDLCLRAGQKLNKRVLEALIRAGALDCLHDNRQAMLQTIPVAMKQAEQQMKNDAFGQNDLFGAALSLDTEQGENVLEQVQEMSEKLRLQGEKDTLGLYLTGHPIDIYQSELDGLVETKLKSLRPEKYRKKWIAGLVMNVRFKVTRNGSKMGFVTIDDKTARMEVVIRPQVFEVIQDSIKVDSVVMIHGEAAEDTFNGGIKFDADQIVTLAEARIEKARALKIFLQKEGFTQPKLQSLQALIEPFAVLPQPAQESGQKLGLPLVIEYQTEQSKVQLISQSVFNPEDELLERLNSEGCQPQVVM
jgi:DNA polymerase-3 subunit alpha